MSHHPVHYEVFSRRTAQGGWTLEMANESRELAVQAAEELLAGGRIAVRVCKETMDVETGEFRSLTVLEKGAITPAKKVKLAPETDTVCTSPQDLYSVHAREKIGRLLEDWLNKRGITPFELLHRPDLAENLEASGTELLHVTQKLSVPESHETGQDLHDLIRRWRGLFDRSCTRVIQDGRKGLFPTLTPQNVMATIDKISGQGERNYIFGGGLAAALKACVRPAAKLEILLSYAQTMAKDIAGREWAMQTLEIPLVEIFASRATLNDVLDQELDLGDAMKIMTRMAASREVEMLAKHDPQTMRLIPPLTGILDGLHGLMQAGHLPQLGFHISKRLMQELKGPRRLKPGNAEGELETLRVLALCMTAAGRDETQRDDIKDAFAERSKKLISADFVDSLLQKARDPIEEAEKLIWLCENMVGASNKRQAARWLSQIVCASKFERALRENLGTTASLAAQRLQVLAKLQTRIQGAALVEQDDRAICEKLGHIGNLIAGDVKLLPHILKGAATPLQKLSMLLSFAAGQAAPFGPLSEQAKGEVIRLLRDPQLRAGLNDRPEILTTLRPMMRAAGLAA